MPNAIPSLDTIFSEAIELPDAAKRADYLARACGSDEALRRRVEALVEAHFHADGSFLEQPVLSADSTAAFAHAPDEPGPALGTAIGPYTLREQIGEGGMGLVFVAEQMQPVRRKVALKIIKPGMDSRQVVARFEAERQALALMDHPNIAKVLDAGTTPEGRPYFVMELVKGEPVTDYCDRNRLNLRQRLELFLQVCQAVQHAHQKGVIHRDLKPSNILIAVHDVTPVAKVIDFGIAKAVGQHLTDKTMYTAVSQFVGTPLYMSPEQAGQRSLDVDTRTDVYALGVLLYELLTGTTPIDPETVRKAGLDEVRRIIREDEPPRPSARMSTLKAAVLSTVAEKRAAYPRRLARQVRGELDWVVMKCLEKDRDRRYESASALAADVQRYLNDEAVQACPPSAGYRLRKFARRNKAAMTMAGLVLLILVIVAGGIGWNMQDRATRQAVAESQVIEALALAEPRLREGNPGDEVLVTSARKAESHLASGLVRHELQERVEQLLADLQMLKTLDEIRLGQTAVKEGRFDTAAADFGYARAFHVYGIDVEAIEPHEAAARIRERAIALHLATALDNWAMARKVWEKETGQESWKRLLEVARAADPDPWRVSLREALARPASKEEWEKLAASAPIQELPATTLHLLGQALQNRGAMRLAVDLLRAAQQQNPADFWINHGLAWALHRIDPPQLEETVAYYRAALALRPKSPGVYLNLGAALSDLGRLDEAIACNRAAIRLKNDYAEAHCNLGNALRKTGRLDEAIACHQEAIRLKPELLEAHFNLAIALKNKGRLDEAIPYYQNAVRLKKDNAEYHYDLGTALYNLGRLDEAIPCFQEAVRLKNDYAEAHTNLGNALQAKGRLDEAIACYREAIAHKPGLFEAHTNLGNALAGKGQLDEAIAEYREALRLKSDSTETHYNLGNAFGQKGRQDEAIACYRKAIEFDSKNWRAYTNLGNALNDKDQPDEAIACFRKAIELNPKFPIAHNGLGISMVKTGKHDEAIACFRKAGELDPRLRGNLGHALNELSWRLATSPDPKTRDSRRAVELAKEAVHLAPKQGTFWNTLGVAQYRAGDSKSAAEALNKSMELQNGGDSNDFFFLAMAHWQLGNKVEARQWYDRAVAWMEKNRPKDEELRRFRAEAAELLGVEPLPVAPTPRLRK